VLPQPWQLAPASLRTQTVRGYVQKPASAPGRLQHLSRMAPHSPPQLALMQESVSSGHLVPCWTQIPWWSQQPPPSQRLPGQHLVPGWPQGSGPSGPTTSGRSVILASFGSASGEGPLVPPPLPPTPPPPPRPPLPPLSARPSGESNGFGMGFRQPGSGAAMKARRVHAVSHLAKCIFSSDPRCARSGDSPGHPRRSSYYFTARLPTALCVKSIPTSGAGLPLRCGSGVDPPTCPTATAIALT
jgi:hypothetical protein